ncbi:MAG: sodium:dicarboxylate symporter [Kangiella sp.]|nr:MAG: sodium:dicarboxylate symporter [Kangiella sp.]
MKIKKYYLILLGPVASLGFYFLLKLVGLDNNPSIAAGITLLTVIWWVTEAIPIPATSLVPFALFPTFGILDFKIVASSLGSHVILLLMGAFMLSKALEKSGAHQRLAIGLLHLVGVSSGKRLVFGFMIAAAFLSMWISNTATTLIMLPMALAIIDRVNNHRLTVSLILGIAYAANIGGLGTIIGTPPNVIFAAIYEEQTGKEFGFLAWMKIGVPIVLLVLPVMALWLTRGVKLQQPIKLPELGGWRVEEKRALIIFGLTALAWMTRAEPFGGWSGLLPVNLIGDSTIALAAVIIMFIMPNGKGGNLLDWKTAKTIPWDMLLLFSGGIAIAKGFNASGLSDLLGIWLGNLTHLPVILMILSITLMVTFLTEITSNTATATLLMPILAVAAVSSGYDPVVFMLPAAMAASCAFSLPVATPPNAIVYGSGKIKLRDMVINGAIMSVFVSGIIGAVTYFLLVY